MVFESAADLDLRVVRYFVRIAEFQGFARAATELHVAQPSLSRQIRGLENQLGVQLFHRLPTGVRLTTAGEEFLVHARGLLQSAAVAMRATAGAPATISFGYFPGLDVTPAVRAYRELRPDVEVRTVNLNWARPMEALAPGGVDLFIARHQFPINGLEIDHLYDEQRYLAVRHDHPLAARTAVGLADLDDVPLPNLPAGMDAGSRAFWLLEPRPDGRPARVGPAMTSLWDTWQMVAQGDIAAVVVKSHARAALPGTVLIPIKDIAPSHVVLALRSGEHPEPVSQFRTVAVEVLRSAGPPG